MTKLDKVIIIKDSINKIINIVYDEYDNGVITDVIDLHTAEHIGHSNSKYPLKIYCDSTNDSVSIGRGVHTRMYYFKSIISKLIGTDGIGANWAFGRDIEELYRRLLDVCNYSDEELKLYFKLTS